MMENSSERAAMTDEQIIAIRKEQVGRFGNVDASKPYADSIAFARAIESALSAVAQTQAVGAVPEGWKLYMVDFSLHAAGMSKYGSAMLVRDADDSRRWQKSLSDEEKEAVALFVSGEGATLPEAIAEAAAKCTPLPSAPTKDQK